MRFKRPWSKLHRLLKRALSRFGNTCPRSEIQFEHSKELEDACKFLSQENLETELVDEYFNISVAIHTQDM